MKNLSKKFAAILTATVMTVSAAGISASADTETDTPKYTGWVSDENGWQYLEDGVPYIGNPRRIDGVYYHFSKDGYGYRSGVNTGLFMSGRRYYKHEDYLPYTGWTDDAKQYCLDGYPVTGDFQIGDTVYSFDSKGIYTGKSSPALLTASCGERISADAERISITVKYNDGNDNVEYTLGEPAKMERWEKGKWKRCGKSSQYAVDDIAYELGGLGDCSVNSAEVSFYPNRYMGGDMPEGYYRVVVPCSYGKTKKDLYAVFRAVPPVEVKMSEDMYRSVNTQATAIGMILTVNSDKENLSAEKIASAAGAGGYKLDIMKKTAEGWKSLGELDNVCAGYTDRENEIEISADIPSGSGYYKAVVTVDGTDYAAAFRVDSVYITPWLDEYSLKKDDITVSFTVKNRLEAPLKLNADPYSLYKKNGENWESVPAADTTTCRGEDPQYMTLEHGQFAAVSFKLSEYYDTSKLEAGDYAILIDGAGYAEFRLTDKEEEKGSFPFSSLKSEDVKEIRFTLYECGSDHTLTASFKNGNDTNGYLERSVDYLRQLKFKSSIEKYSTDAAGGCPLEVTVRLKNGRKKTLYFYESGAVLYNGSKTYICSEYVCPALYDFVIENNDVDRKYYGYRNTP